MYILDQDRRGIVCKFSNIYVCSGRINEIIAFEDFTGDAYLSIGEYATKQRCEEVILEIYKALNRGDKAFKMPKE